MLSARNIVVGLIGFHAWALMGWQRFQAVPCVHVVCMFWRHDLAAIFFCVVRRLLVT